VPANLQHIFNEMAAQSSKAGALVFSVSSSRLIIKLDHHAGFITNDLSLVAGRAFVYVTRIQRGFASIIAFSRLRTSSGEKNQSSEFL